MHMICLLPPSAKAHNKIDSLCVPYPGIIESNFFKSFDKRILMFFNGEVWAVGECPGNILIDLLKAFMRNSLRVLEFEGLCITEM